jgi:hypothetical protein
MKSFGGASSAGPFRIVALTIPLFFVAVLLGDIVGSVNGDGMFIPVTSMDVNEPGQNALIGFDGGVERLVLSVNIKAKKTTEGFHVIPFPSMPRISLGDPSVFGRLTDHMNDHREDIIYSHYHSSIDNGLIAGDDAKGSIEIVMSERIGDHLVTVIKVNDNRDFKEEIEKISAHLGIDIRSWPKGLDAILMNYTERDYVYFSIDQYEIRSDERTVDPLVFEFNTNEVFFPLRISSLFKGSGQINVAIVTPEDLPMGTLYRNTLSNYTEYDYLITEADLSEIDSTLAEMIDGEGVIRYLSMVKDLSDLKEDLIIPVEQNIVSASALDHGRSYLKPVMIDGKPRILSWNYECDGVVCYSVPEMERLWICEMDDDNYNPEYRVLDTGDRDTLIFEYEARSEVVGLMSVDAGNGDLIWKAEFEYRNYFYDKGQIKAFRCGLGYGVAFIGTSIHLFEANDGDEIPIAEDGRITDACIVRHGDHDLIAYYLDDKCRQEIFSPFEIDYTDPRDGSEHDNFKGTIALGEQRIVQQAMGVEHFTGEPITLEELLSLDKFTSADNRTGNGWPGSTTTHTVFYDTDFGQLVLWTDSYTPRLRLRCIDRYSSEKKWDAYLGDDLLGNPESFAFFSDLDGDGKKEMALDVGYQWEGGRGTFVIDNTGKVIVKKDRFSPQQILKESDVSYLAGSGEDEFSCFELKNGSCQYRYEWPDGKKTISVLVSDWDEVGADVSVLMLNADNTVSTYRSNPAQEGFDLVARQYYSDTLLGMGDYCGTIIGDIVYIYQNDNRNVRTTYPSLEIPEENLGIQGLKAPVRKTERNASPYFDYIVIISVLILIVTFIEWGRWRRD